MSGPEMEIRAAVDALNLADAEPGDTLADRIGRLAHDRDILRRALTARYPNAPRMCTLDRMLLAAATIPALWTSVRRGTSTFDAANDSPRLPFTERQRWAVENFLEQGPRVLLDLVADVTAALDAAEAGADEDRGAPAKRDPGASLAVRIHRLSEMRCRADRRLFEASAALDAAGIALIPSEGPPDIAAGIHALAARVAQAATFDPVYVADALRQYADALRASGDATGREVDLDAAADAVDAMADPYSPKAGAEAEALRKAIEDLRVEMAVRGTNAGNEMAGRLQALDDTIAARDSLRWLEERDADKAEVERLRALVARTQEIADEQTMAAHAVLDAAGVPLAEPGLVARVRLAVTRASAADGAREAGGAS